MTTALEQKTVAPELRAKLDRLALAARILEMEGHGSRTLGHVAMRDPEGRGIWIKRWGLSLGEVFDWTDFQLVDFDGHLLLGDGGKRHTEWPIHARIMKARPDIHVTGHTHPLHGAVFSASDEPLQLITPTGWFTDRPPPRYTTTSEIVCTAEEGDSLARILGDHNTVFLRNHGIVFTGDTIEKMTLVGIEMEAACRDMLMIKNSGLKFSFPPAAESRSKYQAFEHSRNIELFFDYYTQKLAAAQAAGHPDLPKVRRR